MFLKGRALPVSSAFPYEHIRIAESAPGYPSYYIFQSRTNVVSFISFIYFFLKEISHGVS